MGAARRKRLMGLPVDLVTLEEAVGECLARAMSGSMPPLRVITLNPEMVMRARRDRDLAACFAGEILVVPDGTGVVLAGRRRGWREMRRVTGIDLLIRLAEEGARRGLPLFLYGGEPGVAERAAEALRRRCPGLVVAGAVHGYLAPKELEDLPGRIAASGARLLFVGLGVPRQEIWLRQNLGATGARVGMGVGGSFDTLAGRIPRAPAAMRRMGLEWAYRVWREPRRWRRLLVMPGFLWLALRGSRAPEEEERLERPGS